MVNRSRSGSSKWAPMATKEALQEVTGPVIASTFLSLVLVPVLYVVLERLREWRHKEMEVPEVS